MNRFGPSLASQFPLIFRGMGSGLLSGASREKCGLDQQLCQGAGAFLEGRDALAVRTEFSWSMTSCARVLSASRLVSISAAAAYTPSLSLRNFSKSSTTPTFSTLTVGGVGAVEAALRAARSAPVA